MEASYQKQMMINRLPLPRDIVDNELKSYVFHDKISSEARRNKQIFTENFKTNIFSTRTNGFDNQNEVDPHWAIGTVNHNENLQLQATTCERCGNYLIFSSMFTFTPSQLVNITCHCIPENPVEIMWDQQQDMDVDTDVLSQTTQETLLEYYDDEDIIQDDVEQEY